MSADRRSQQIQHLLQEKFALFRWGRCVKHCGFTLAAFGYAIFEFYTEVPPKFVEHLPLLGVLYAPSAAWIKTAAMIAALTGAALFVGGYGISYASWALRKASDTLWAKYLQLRRLGPIDYSCDALTSLVFELGNAQNSGSFVRLETLKWLYAVNKDYIQAWGTASREPSGETSFKGVCFFVVAPLNRGGVVAMRSRDIRKNKDLRADHVAPNFNTARGLYVIEVFGATFFEKGAILYFLQRCLERRLKQKLANPRFPIFTRPVNPFGYRQVKRFGFENLGDSLYEMHMWHAAPGGGLCGSRS